MPELQALIKKRGMIKATLTIIKKFIDKFVQCPSQVMDLEQLEGRMEKLNEAWKEFHDVEYQILLISEDQSEAEEFEEKFYDTKASLKRLLKVRSPSYGFNTNNSNDNKSYEHSTDQTSDLRLPRVMIEAFSGDYAKWQSFQDQFETSIHHKDNLSNIHKFQYLKSLLKNDAASLIRHMSLTDANYTLAWEKLKKRYNKKKYSVKEFIELFLNQAAITTDGHKQLRAICDTSDEVLLGLQALGTEWQSRDPWLIHILIKKLDIQAQQAWAKHSNDIEFPTINGLLEFLTERCDALEACTSTKRPVSHRQNTHRVHAVTTTFNKCSMCNSDNHPLFKCYKFKSLNSAERIRFVENNNICENCLSSSHNTSSCQSQRRCFICGSSHHSLLHSSYAGINSKHSKPNLASNKTQPASNYFTTCAELEITKTADLPSINTNRTSINNVPPTINENYMPSFNSWSTPVNKTSSSNNNVSTINDKISINSTPIFKQPSTSNKSNGSNLQNAVNYHCSTSSSNTQNNASTYNNNAVNTLLSTAMFNIIDDFGIPHLARGLLDSGSQTTLITESCVKRIGLHRTKSHIIINGLASQKAGTTRGEVKLRIASISEHQNSVNVRALILTNLTSKLPINEVDDSNFPILSKLNLADPSYKIPGIIDMILGNDIFYEILLPQKIQIADHFFGQLTIFGWVLGGQVGHSHTNAACFHSTVSSNVTEELLKRFWEMEEIHVSPAYKSTEDDCEHHYTQNTTRAADGRYVVRFPFKMAPEVLGTSYHQARSRFYSLEKKLEKYPDMKRDYINFMKEYLTLGHMEKVQCEDNAVNQSHQSYHLPHHCVLKETSSTTKLRVVFDGSCKSTTGYSLNDMLLTGPTIQDDLRMILLRFRTHKIAISADIEKMYRQVVIHPAQRDFQRIIWRDSPAQEVQQFRLTTVTYGTSSAPFLACRTLHQLANDYNEQCPGAANRLKSDFYVDDMLTGCDDLVEAITIYKEMTSLLKKGGFNLRKWMTNDQNLSINFQESEIETNFLEFEGMSLIKTLGLLWNPQGDSFTFKVNLEDTENSSKRSLLSEASRIFDPLGWLAPSIILIKILFQQLWLRNLTWDEELPVDISEKWTKIRSSLHNLQNIQIPRFIFTNKNETINIQLHGFSDASELAYGAAIYIRVQHSDGNTFVNLLAAKTKVSPIKQISIPRLELCAAVLLCRLIKYVQQAVKLEIDSIYAWTDSQIVLAWLSDIPRRWKCFVGNRTSYILEHISRDKWLYIQSKQNPADAASRGLMPHSLIANKLWWNGPDWLAKDVEHWPKNRMYCDPVGTFDDNNLEVRRSYITNYHSSTNSSHACERLVTRYSSLKKIHRILSYIFRFMRNARRVNNEAVPIKECTLPPTVEELTLSENCCVRWVQSEAFSDDIQNIKQHGEVKSKSVISSLTPFIDDKGIMRVGGRISNSACNFDTKYPIILPQNHVYTKLIVDMYHRDNVHPGPTLLTSIIRQRFWIVGCRKVTRWYVQKCILCFMRRRVQNQQLMADLPIERVSTGRPFLNTGVDYAGPLYIKDRKGPGKHRITKAYIALFVCFSVKAIHIELVTDMTTEAFLAALKRFVSRRGIPCQIHCDNGSNFVGARNELHNLYKLFKSDNHTKLILEFLSPQKTKFKFNPPNAPHFGGLWESNIKSVKAHLNRVCGSTSLTYEEANTLLIQIEAVLNSRPLCAVSNDVTSYDVLTPAHFLIGEPLTSIPEPDLSHIKLSRMSKWQHIQNRVQSFWRSWSRDYLHTLNQRFKWRTKTKNISIDQLVLIRDDNIPQSHWIIGRVQEVHRGKDDHIRIATVKTTRGVMKRPIVKLIPLPIETDSSGQFSDKPQTSDK